VNNELTEVRCQAYRLLSYRWYTKKEIETKLIQKGYSKEMVQVVISELEEMRYLDDQRFTMNWIEGRAQRKLLGKKRLKQELKDKGIEERIILQKLEDFFSAGKDLELALLAARKKASLSRDLDKDKLKRRLADFLQRRGFDYQIIKKVITILEEEVNNK